jgi:hypothetical protein
MRLPTLGEEVRFAEHWSPSHRSDEPFLFDDPVSRCPRLWKVRSSVTWHIRICYLNH